MEQKTYRQFIVCRDSEFDAQVAEWGGTHFIIALPASEISEISEISKISYPIYCWNEQGEVTETQLVDVDAKDGGVGFARCFIELLAHEWGLKAVWMVDDTLLRLMQAEIDGNALGVSSCSFADMMMGLEETFRSDDPEIRSQVGDPLRYTVLGTARDFRMYGKETALTKAHSQSHVYSVCLVHIDACFKQEHPALFPPRKFWEDIELNFLALKAGLWVVKYHRFCQIKKNFTPSFLPPSVPRWKFLP